jgi:hypothetical protein
MLPLRRFLAAVASRAPQALVRASVRTVRASVLTRTAGCRRRAAVVVLVGVALGSAAVMPHASARAAARAVEPPPAASGKSRAAPSPLPSLTPPPTTDPSPTSSPSPSPTDSPDDAGPCGVSPILHAFCSVGHAIQNAPGAIVGGVASSVGDSIIGAMTRWVADGAAWVLNQVTTLIDNGTTPDLTAQWFQRNYATMVTLAGVLLAIFLFFATVQGIVANKPSMILRAYLLHAPIAAVGTVLAVALVSRGLQATDAMSTAVSAHLHHDVARIAERVGKAVVLASRVTGDGSLFVAFLGALVAVVVAVILWLELLIRQAAIDLCVLFLPLVLAAFVWPATSRWLRRFMNTLTAIVLSKFVIVAVLALSASALADNTNDGGIKAILVGVVLLVLAAVCPYLVFRLLPGVEMAVTGRWLHGGMRIASRGAPTPTGRGPWRGGRPMPGRSSGVTVAAWSTPATAAAATAARAARTAATAVRNTATAVSAGSPVRRATPRGISGRPKPPPRGDAGSQTPGGNVDG